MKLKEALFLFFIFSILVLPLIVSQDLGDAGDELQGQVDELEEAKNKYSETTYWEDKWDYLEKEWKAILLKNKIIFTLDSFFTKINFIFKFLFAMDYSISIILFGIIFLWLFVFVDVGGLIKSWGIVGEGFLPYIASFFISVVFSWIKLFESIILIFGRLIFSPKYTWVRFFIFFAIFIGFIILQYLTAIFSKFLKAKREGAKRKSADLAQKSIKKFADKLSKASSKT
ncbi:MAG: hypothetical protein AABX30_00670 [Nanoarchaeota archaeon]